MAINFEKKTPDWENVGAEPDAELKKGGFRAGYKPPAAYFNWFFNRISESVKELQEKLVANLKALAFKDKVGNGDITDVAAGKVTQDSTHRLITDTERTDWNDANSKKHTHGNKSTVDKLTETLLTNWTTAYTHVSNKSNPHGVTKAQVGLGNVPNAATNDQTPTFTQADTLGNLVSGEKLTVSMGKIMKAIAELISHKADAVLHVTAAERTKWNAVTNKVDKVSGKQLSTNDYTTAEKNKLAGIAAGAEVNVQPDWNATDTASDAYIKNRPSAYPPASHTHTKAQVTDFPTSLKNPAALTLSLNGSSQGSYDGSTTKSINITASGVGAAPVSHSHDDRYYTESEVNTKLGEKVTVVGGDIAATTVSEFEASTASYPVPTAGESPKTLWGKMAKFCSDIKNWMTGVCLIGQIVNNCVTDNAKLPLSAAQGKALMDLYTVLNTNLRNTINALGTEHWTTVESISIPANNWAYGVKKITLPPGKYIIIAHADIPPGDNVGTLSVDETTIVERQQSFYSSPVMRKVTTAFFENVTAQKAHKVSLWCSAAVTAQNCEVMAVRIK